MNSNENKMRFKKKDILSLLKKNREAHIKIVQEAQQGFRERAIKMCKEKLAKLEAGERTSPNMHLNLPISHVDDFDRAVEMLELCVDEEIFLSEDQFQCYVRNKWEWEHMFLASNAMYSETARTQALPGDLPEE